MDSREVSDSSLGPLKSFKAASASWAVLTYLWRKSIPNSSPPPPAISCDWETSPVISWELQLISSPPGEAYFPDGKNKFDGLLPMERRCVPGASVNEKSRVQAACRHTQLLGGVALDPCRLLPRNFACVANFVSHCMPHERKERARQEKCLKFPRASSIHLLSKLEPMYHTQVRVLQGHSLCLGWPGVWALFPCCSPVWLCGVTWMDGGESHKVTLC